MIPTKRRYVSGTIPATTAAEMEGRTIKRDEPGLAASVARPVPASLVRVSMPARFQSTIRHDPNAYVLDVQGAGLQPKLADGDRIVISPTAPLLRGRIVVLHFRDGCTMARQLLCPPTPGLLSATGQVARNTRGVIQVETLTPAEVTTLPMSDLIAIHAVVDAMRPEERGPAPRPAAPQGEGRFVDAINALCDQWHHKPGDAAYHRATGASRRRRAFHVVQGDRP